MYSRGLINPTVGIPRDFLLELIKVIIAANTGAEHEVPE